ncbi:hypothetical protein [Psychrobacillus soli]|uniref:Permease n=1 Tax=Psychrobacillus soli TaxID=1543965 RepID=A0A544T777_9BACI|nr:hypothetical protein [Psychrobacillus soli]TQR13305.1 hypothetical protein FG383_12290 [Psychrobacillus soli]
MLKNNNRIVGIMIVLSMFLLILGVKYVLGQDLVIMNFVAFAAFSVAVGVIAGALLMYKLHKGFYIFAIGLAIGFIELFRSFLVGTEEFGDLVGILSLFIFTSFGLVIGLIVEGILYLMKKNK